MNKDQSSYRQIVKATSIYGGVQVIQILINIIKSKFIAILLGPSGMGIAGLLTSSIEFIQSLTSFGLKTSAVKDISEADASKNELRISIKIKVFRRLVWITGLIGACVTLIFSSKLSELTFGNQDYTYAFILIAVTLLFNQLSDGQKTLLQGLRKIKLLAKASLYGSLLGLITTVPLYYFYGIDGIVPGIIVTSATALILSWYFTRNIPLSPVKISARDTISEGRDMLNIGFLIGLNGLILGGISFIVKLFIGRTGSVDDVGLYTAGFTLINTYVGLIFTAMSTDYFPRLSALSNDNEQSRSLINQQAEIAILILAPIIITLMIGIKWVVILLYSSKFLPINDMILYAALGMFFKAASWSIAFIFLAKSASKLFFINEIFFNTYFLLLNLAGYYWLGLTGLGIAFLVSYVLYLIQLYFVTQKVYQFTFDQSFIKLMLLQVCMAFFTLLAVKLTIPLVAYTVGGILMCFSIYLSYRELDKRINIKNLINKFLGSQSER